MPAEITAAQIVAKACEMTDWFGSAPVVLVKSGKILKLEDSPLTKKNLAELTEFCLEPTQKLLGGSSKTNQIGASDAKVLEVNNTSRAQLLDEPDSSE